jgi:nucleotide-binding universal stress UspA family protein
MKVLVAYDGSVHADAAIQDLKHAGLPGNAEVLVVTIANDAWPPASLPYEEEGQFDNPWNATMKQTAEIAAEAANRVRLISTEWTVHSEPLWGDPVEILLKTIDHWKPDLVVVGSHGRGAAGRFLMGSVSTELVHRAPCSVRVTRLPREHGVNPDHIVLAVDGSKHADGAVQAVAHRHWPAGTDIDVIAVFDSLVPSVARYAPSLEGNTFATEPAYQVIAEADEEMKSQLHDAVQNSVVVLRSVGLNAKGHVIDGNPLTQIAVEASLRHAGTVFVGARGLGAIDRLMLGSVSSAIVKHAHCSVEVVRSKK